MIELRALGALKPASEARNENVPAKRADFRDIWKKINFYFFICFRWVSGNVKFVCYYRPTWLKA